MLLKIKNFQSISNAVLDLSGFTVIEGKTDTGKSAVRRALELLLYNQWDKSDITKGASDTEVTLVIDDRNIISIRKPSNTYITVIDGIKKVHNKIGKSVPDDIRALGFKWLETNIYSYNLHVSRQPVNEPLFMTSFSDKEITQIFSSIFKVDNYDYANTLVKRDIRENESRLNFLTEQIVSKKSKLDSVSKELQSVKNAYDKLMVLEEKVSLIDSYGVSARSLEDSQVKLSVTKTNLKTVFKVLTLFNYLTRKSSLETVNNRVTMLDNKLSEFDKFRETYNISLALYNLFNNHKNIDSFTERHSTIIVKKKEVSQLISYIYSLDTYLNIKSISSKLNKVDTRLNKLKSIQDKLTNYLEYNSLLDLKQDSTSKLSNCLNRVIYTESEIDSVAICPTCNQPLLGDTKCSKQ
ncbi:hypothetical protein ThvES_00013500 [Thiovulum sp. ES]|nr:hypothetical protein ThvES_00013500 [Thiovulum sp. ES]